MIHSAWRKERSIKMQNDDAKRKIYGALISSEIGLYTTMYGPDTAVLTISNIVSLIDGLTKYRARKAIKELISDGLVEYKSQGRPAIVSCGEIEELVCESAPPINGYSLTKKGRSTEEWRRAYKEWEKSMEEWANNDTL